MIKVDIRSTQRTMSRLLVSFLFPPPFVSTLSLNSYSFHQRFRTSACSEEQSPLPTLRVSQRVFQIRAPIHLVTGFFYLSVLLSYTQLSTCRKWKKILQWSSRKPIRSILKIFRTKHPPVMLSSRLRSTPNACCRAIAIPICLTFPKP